MAGLADAVPQNQTVQVLAIVIPCVATIVTGLVAAFINIAGKKRESRLGEIYEAFEERGKLVDSLRDTRDEQQLQISSLKTQVDMLEVENKNCLEGQQEMKAEIATLRDEIHVHKRTTTHEA